MAARSAGISGLAVTLATAGGLLLFTGIRNISVITALKEIMSGQTPHTSMKRVSFQVTEGAAGGSSGGTQPANYSGGAAPGAHPEIANAASKYLGVRYVWAKANPADGFDCSGLVTWVLHHDLGYNLPSNSHTVTGQFLVWGGARTIPRDQCSAGDLVCWPGHIGIAINGGQMINAPKPGDVVKVGDIWKFPAPTIRRVIAPGELKST